jgi:hypothetical protein
MEAGQQAFKNETAARNAAWAKTQAAKEKAEKVAAARENNEGTGKSNG